MKTIIYLLVLAMGCIIAYKSGQTDGRRESLGYSQTSCILAIKEVCANPAAVCDSNNK